MFVRSSLSYMYIKLDGLFTVNPLQKHGHAIQRFFFQWSILKFHQTKNKILNIFAQTYIVGTR